VIPVFKERGATQQIKPTQNSVGLDRGPCGWWLAADLPDPVCVRIRLNQVKAKANYYIGNLSPATTFSCCLAFLAI